jgi:hypothetical protein
MPATIEPHHDISTDEIKDHPGVLRIYLSRAKFKKNGREYETTCPFHNEKTPSCKINQKNGRWLWFCHGCQRGGSIIDFVMELDHVEENSAIADLKQELGLAGPGRSEAPEIKPDAFEEQESLITVSLAEYVITERKLASNTVAQGWLLTKRGIRHETARRLHIGYRQTITAKDEGLQDILRSGWFCFPSITGDIVTSIKYRSVVRKAFSRKWGMVTDLFNAETMEMLEDVYLCAGEFDAMVLEQAGFHAVSMSSDSMRITPAIQKKLELAGRLILAGDSDESGVRAMDRIAEKNPEALRLWWPKGIKDANDLWLRNTDDAEFKNVIIELTEAAAKTATSVDEDVEEKAPDSMPICPPEVLTGGYIGELTELLTKGTTIPPEFVFHNVAMLLGAMVNGKIGFAGHEDIHTRLYSVNISNVPRAGKGTAWDRTGEEKTGLLSGMLAERGIKVMDAGLYGSGEFMIGELSAHAREVQKGTLTVPVNVIARSDEMSEIFEKSKALGSTLKTKLLTMFESNTISTGSFKNKGHAVYNLHFSIAGDFTKDGFEKSFAGQGAGGSGLLSRFSYTFARKRPYHGRFPEIDAIATVKCLARIRDCLDRLDAKSDLGLGDTGPFDCVPDFESREKFIPTETPGATAMCEAFLKELDGEDENFVPELSSHFKRYLLLQTVFSDNQVIDEPRTKQAILWTWHQLAIRKALWPEDGGNLVEQFERKIQKALVGRKLSLARLMNWCHVDRAGSGGVEVFMRAHKALMFANRIATAGKTRKGSLYYQLQG